MLSIRAEAQQRGFLRYFTNMPCRKGHIAERQTSNGTCLKCASTRLHKSRLKDPTKFRLYDTIRQKTDHRRLQKAASERKNRKKEWRRAIRRAERMNRIASQKQRTPIWSDLNKIKEIYREAQKMGPDFHVDHIVPLNGRTVSGLHIPENLQIIPARENLLKGPNWI